MSKLDDLRIDTPVPKPRRRASMPWVPVALVIFAVVALAWVGRERIASWLGAAGTAPAGSAVDAPVDTGAVSAVPPVAGPPGSISAAGYLEVIPPGPVVVSALVAGRVSEVLVSPGASVAAGQVLARLDASALQQESAILARQVELAQTRLKRLEAGSRTEEIVQAQARVTRAEAAAILTQSELARSEQLYRQGVIAHAALDTSASAARQAGADLMEAQAQLALLEAGTRREDTAIAEAEVRAIQAQQQQLAWEIGQCTLRAPGSGVVLEQFVQPGDWLSPGSDNPRSGAACSIFDPAQIQAWVDVSQRDSASISIGQRVELTTDAFPQRKVGGAVSRIMPAANLQKNTVQVKIAIDTPPADFRPELSVKVTFLPPEKSESGNAPVDQAHPVTEK